MVVNGEDVAVEPAVDAVPDKTAVDDASDSDSDDDMPELGKFYRRFNFCASAPLRTLSK
jgi:hypothetical protein